MYDCMNVLVRFSLVNYDFVILISLVIVVYLVKAICNFSYATRKFDLEVLCLMHFAGLSNLICLVINLRMIFKF